MPKRSENDPEVVEGNLVMQTKNTKRSKIMLCAKTDIFHHTCSILLRAQQ